MRTAFLLLSVCLVTPGEIELKPYQNNGLEARLRVAVAEHPATQGLAEMTYRLIVTGPPGLEVKPAQLEDPLAAWQSQSSSQNERLDSATRHTETLQLRQVKPGFQQPPLLSVRLRSGANEEWQRAEWTEILEVREPPLEPYTPEPITWPYWSIALGGLLLLLPALGRLLVWLQHKKTEPPLPPNDWAQQELQKLEMDMESIPSPAYHTRLADILRGYLEKQWGLQAMGKTTAELLDALPRLNNLPSEAEQQLSQLGDLLKHCDHAKFAPVEASPQQCREATAQARQIINALSNPSANSRPTPAQLNPSTSAIV